MSILAPFIFKGLFGEPGPGFPLIFPLLPPFQNAPVPI